MNNDIKGFENEMKKNGNIETENNIVTFKKGYIYPVWWCISWFKYCSVGRKISSIILFLFFILAISLPIRMIFGEFKDISTTHNIILLIFCLVFFIWPFILVIAPPESDRKYNFCCSGCGRIDNKLRVVEYKIGFALFGLIPISGLWKRVLCKNCRNYLYRFSIALQNIFALLFFPVGTVFGIIWFFKNMTSKTINIHESIMILDMLKKDSIEQKSHAQADLFEKSIKLLKQSINN